jgi:hypothetical protein
VDALVAEAAAVTREGFFAESSALVEAAQRLMASATPRPATIIGLEHVKRRSDP